MDDPRASRISVSARGSAWALGSDLIGQVLRLGAGLVVAATLGPEAFSLWAVLVLFISAGTALDEAGLHMALVLRRPWTSAEESATFWVSALIGIGGAAILLATGALIEMSETIDGLTPYLLVFCLTLLTSTLAVIPRAHLSSTFSFRTLAVRESSARIAGAVLTVGLALATRSIWALLLGAVAQRVAEHVLLFAARPMRVAWPPRIAAFRPMARFSAHAASVNLLGFASTQAGTIVVAATLTRQDLGLWALASMIFVTAQSRFAAVLSRVAYPILTDVPIEARAAAYIRGLRVVGSAMGLVTVLLALLTPYLIQMVLDDGWERLWPIAIALVPAGLARGVGPFTNSFIYSMNATNIALRLELVRFPLSLVVIWFATAQWGLLGAAWSSAPLLIAGITARAVFLRKELGLDLRTWIGAILPMAASACASGAIIGTISTYFDQTDSVLAACLTAVSFALLYTVALRAVSAQAFADIATALRSLRPRDARPRS